MPRVTFVNEHRVVDAAAGAALLDVAREAGVALGAVCWVEGEVSARTWRESLRGMRGSRRAPGSVRLVGAGDVRVYSAPAAASRVAVAREIAPPPSPVSDPSAPRKGIDAASTAAHVHGHPSMIGRGAPPASVASPPAPPESHPNAARPLTTIPPPATDPPPASPSIPPPPQKE